MSFRSALSLQQLAIQYLTDQLLICMNLQQQSNSYLYEPHVVAAVWNDLLALLLNYHWYCALMLHVFCSYHLYWWWVQAQSWSVVDQVLSSTSRRRRRHHHHLTGRHGRSIKQDPTSKEWSRCCNKFAADDQNYLAVIILQPRSENQSKDFKGFMKGVNTYESRVSSCCYRSCDYSQLVLNLMWWVLRH